MIRRTERIMKKFAYFFILATTLAFSACTTDDDTTTSSSKSSSSSSSSSASTGTATSSSSTDSSSDYLNARPDTIDFTNDDINQNFSASATTTITFSESGSATVDNQLSGDAITVDGNYVTATLANSGTVLKLTGTTTSGAIKITSDKKFELNLSGVSITNPNGTAINIQNGHAFVVVDGTNTLSDSNSAGYSDDYSTDAKSVFHNEDKLRFSGSGTLTITALNSAEKHAMSSDDWVFVNGPTLTITSGTEAGQGVKVNDGFIMQSGTVNITAKAAGKKGINSEAFVYTTGGSLTCTTSGGCVYDDEDSEYKAASAISADGYILLAGGTVTATNSGAGGKGIKTDYIFHVKGGTVTATSTGSTTSSSVDKSPKGVKAEGGVVIEGGTTNVSSSNHEGIESKSVLNVTGGLLYAKASDDAINSAGQMNLSGGYVGAYSTDNDAIDANGNLYIKGSTVYAISTAGGAETAIDANTEGGYSLYVESGNLVAYPSLENGASLTQTCYTTSISSTNNWNALYNGSDVALVFKVPTKGTYIVSTPSTSLSTGVTASDGTTIFGGYVYKDANVSGGSQAALSTYSSGSAMGGMGGGMPSGGGPGGR